MLMQPGQDGLLQALLEPYPGLLIAVCNRTAQELQARHLDRLVSITSHVDAPCVPTGATPLQQDDQGSLPPNPPATVASSTACMAAAESGSRS